MFIKEKDFVNTERVMHPMGWSLVRFDQIISLEYGKGLPEQLREKGDCPVYGSNGVVGYHTQSIVKGPGIIVGRKGTIGAVVFSESDFWPIDTTYFVKVKDEQVDIKWLFYQLTYSNLSKLGSADVVPGLRRDLVNNLMTPLPPLPEQKAIVQVLGIVDSVIELSDRVIAKSKLLKRGLMQQLLTHGIGHTETKQTPIGSIPKEWKIVKIADVSSHVGSGLTPRGGSKTYLNEGIPLIRSQNVLMNKLDLSDVAYISKDTHEFMSRSIVYPEDVLLNITGASIGRVSVVPGSIKQANVNQHVCRIRLIKEVLPQFAAYYLSSPDGQNQIMSFQAGATRQGLNYQQVRAIQMPCPSIEEQEKIAEILSTADLRIDTERKERATLDRVKRGLMDLLLTGKVRIKVD